MLIEPNKIYNVDSYKAIKEMPDKSYEQKLTEDLISIIHYFAMKSYSHRKKLNKIRKELEDMQNEE